MLNDKTPYHTYNSGYTLRKGQHLSFQTSYQNDIFFVKDTNKNNLYFMFYVQIFLCILWLV